MKVFKIGLLGKKVGMTKVIREDGTVVPVTVLEVGPCSVIRKKTQKKDSYSALQLGFEEKTKNVNKPDEGSFKKAKVNAKRFIQEIRFPGDEEIASYEEGKDIKVTDVFKAGEYVDVTGTSIGKGFQGVMKRYNMKGLRETHGTHEVKRHGGSIGCRFPQRVLKGQKMPGHMGTDRVTVQNLVIEDIKAEDNLLLIHGAVPGRKGFIVVKKAVKRP
ncbi:50S ribosomal protein L3 [Candidatus Auribacterota bacterium]